VEGEVAVEQEEEEEGEEEGEEGEENYWLVERT